MDGTILVADDDRTIRTVLTQALTRAGCRVHATSSLVTLLRWIEEGKGDVVVSDVIMPDGDALDLLPTIAQERPGPAGHRDHRPEHGHDRDPGGRGGRLRLPAEALRSHGAAEARGPRARSTSAASPAPEGRRSRTRGRQPAADRPHARDAGGLPARRAPDEHRPRRDDHRRKRHRQGARRPRDARLLRPPARSPFVVAISAAEPRHEKGPAARSSPARQRAGSIFLDEVGDLPHDAQTRLRPHARQPRRECRRPPHHGHAPGTCAA